MKVKLHKGNADIIRGLRKAGYFGLTDSEVANSLVQRAIHDLIMTDYVQKMRRFLNELREMNSNGAGKN